MTRSTFRRGATWVRSVDTPALLERFLVAAAVAFVGIRLYLAAAGYPQVGGGGLHIAHLLWGGLLMLVALVVLLAFLGRDKRWVMAVVGGAGWGAFIDELGKFITSDVNYFYRPALALIYASFVGLVVTSRLVIDRSRPSAQAALAQTLEIAQAVVIRGFRPGELAQMHALLRQADANHPLTRALRQALVEEMQTVERGEPRGARLDAHIAATLTRIRVSRFFLPLVVVLVASVGLLGVGQLLSEIVNDPGFREGDPAISGTDMIRLVSSAVGGGLLLVGTLVLGRDRLAGLRVVRTGLLVFLLLVQPLRFYAEQVLALAALGVDLVLYAAVSGLISQEEGEHMVIPADTSTVGT